jgi:DNA-directed RNA polymerase specialized sigma subunit
MKNKKYITNKDLYIEIIVSKEMGKLTSEAQRMLLLLGKKLINKFSYTNADDKLDCLQNGYIQMFSNWHNFDEQKGTNAFAYFTEIFKRGVARGWRNLYRFKGDDEGKVKFISISNGFNNENAFDMNI